MLAFFEKGRPSFTCFRSENLTFTAHLHEEIELIYMLDGLMDITNGSEEITLKKGELSVFLPHVIHSYKSKAASSFIILIFNANFIGMYKKQLIISEANKKYLCAEELSEEVIYAIHKIYQESQGSQNIGTLTGYLHIIFSKILPLLGLEEIKVKSDSDMIKVALQYISDSFQSPLQLQDIAKHLNISPFYLSRTFSAKIGSRIDNYINELRINYATHLLQHSIKPITEIALESGFDNQRTFNRVFKAITGVTPREFRIKNVHLQQ